MVSKTVGRNLAVNETALRRANDSLSTVSGAGLTAEKAASISTAESVVVDLRLKAEFPVLASVAQSLRERAKPGTPVQPMSSHEVKALLEIIQDFSHAEVDLVSNLHGLKLITEADFTELIQPAVKASN